MHKRKIKEGFPEEVAVKLRLKFKSCLIREKGGGAGGGTRLRDLERHTASKLLWSEGSGWVLFCHKLCV